MLSYCLPVSSSAQGTVVKAATTLKVASGTTIVEPTKLTVETGATVDNLGTIILKGNLDNQNGSLNDMGAGTFEFSGTSHQYILGPNKMNNLTVNNSKGVEIKGNTEVDGVLTLTSGLVTLGSYNLLLGTDASVAGSPSATNMVVATGDGVLQKQFSDGTGARSFTYPVGDSTGTAGYSPVTLSFTAGTYSTGIAGVNLINSAYTGMTGDYLNRYWNTYSSGITGFTYDAQFNYVAGAYPATGDVTGTEANIYCTQVTPELDAYSAANTTDHYLPATGLTALGTFTGGPGALVVSPFVWLDGPYNTSNHNMNTTLNPLIPLNQPYNVAPWNYAGTESVVTMPADVVDWVLISIRIATDGVSATAATQQGMMAALLKSDGTIVSTTGSNLIFNNVAVPGGKSLFLVIKHRNHVGIMANTGATKTGSVYSYDFRNAANKVYPGDGTGHKLLETGAYGLYAADANGDGNVWVNDNSSYYIPTYYRDGYLPADFNLDGHVWVNDNSTKYVPNYYKSSTIPN
jgi:hypothetical protein